VVLTLLAVAATFGSGILLVEEKSRDAALWASLSVIAFAEALLGLSLANIISAKPGRGEPFRFGVFTILFLYFIFTVAMAVITPHVEARQYIWFTHVAAGVCVAGMLLFSGMAERHKNVTDGEFASARLSKIEFQAALAEIADLARNRNITNAAFYRRLARLADMARYAAESVAGTEPADAGVRQTLAMLKEKIEANETTAFESDARNIEQALAKRETLIKNLRA
jgi:hypothetical protein